MDNLDTAYSNPMTLTEKCSENEMILTGYSPDPISYLEWCELEVNRMNKAGGSVELWRSGFGFCAVKTK
jgi:hypothetical protein